MNIILAESTEIESGAALRLSGRRAEHITRVLHAAVGCTVRVGIVNGPRGNGIVTAISPDCVSLACQFESTIPPAPLTDVILAMPRPKVMKRLWAQLAAMGVRRIFVTNAEKVERNYFDTHWLNPVTYRELLLEGLEQAGDTRLPEVRVIRRLKPFIEDECASFGGRKFLAHPGVIPDSAVPHLDSSSEVLLAVGPEGGWTAYELDMLARCGFAPFSLGNRKLRTDTACIALLAAISTFRRPG